MMLIILSYFLISSAIFYPNTEVASKGAVVEEEPTKIKKAEFVKVAVDCFSKMRESIPIIMQLTDTLDLSVIKTRASSKLSICKTPLGKEFWQEIVAFTNNPSNQQAATFTANWSLLLSYYNEGSLEQHYKANKAAYSTTAEGKEVWVSQLKNELFVDSNLINKAVEAHKVAVEAQKAAAGAQEKEFRNYVRNWVLTAASTVGKSGNKDDRYVSVRDWLASFDEVLKSTKATKFGYHLLAFCQKNAIAPLLVKDARALMAQAIIANEAFLQKDGELYELWVSSNPINLLPQFFQLENIILHNIWDKDIRLDTFLSQDDKWQNKLVSLPDSMNLGWRDSKKLDSKKFKDNLAEIFQTSIFGYNLAFQAHYQHQFKSFVEEVTKESVFTWGQVKQNWGLILNDSSKLEVPLEDFFNNSLLRNPDYAQIKVFCTIWGSTLPPVESFKQVFVESQYEERPIKLPTTTEKLVVQINWSNNQRASEFDDKFRQTEFFQTQAILSFSGKRAINQRGAIDLLKIVNLHPLKINSTGPEVEWLEEQMAVQPPKFSDGKMIQRVVFAFAMKTQTGIEYSTTDAQYSLDATTDVPLTPVGIGGSRSEEVDSKTATYAINYSAMVSITCDFEISNREPNNPQSKDLMVVCVRKSFDFSPRFPFGAEKAFSVKLHKYGEELNTNTDSVYLTIDK